MMNPDENKILPIQYQKIVQGFFSPKYVRSNQVFKDLS